MPEYIIEPKTVFLYRNRKRLPSPVEPVLQKAPVRVIGIHQASSKLVSDLIRSGHAVLITKPKKYHGYDVQALVTLFGHLGSISPVIDYGKKKAVLVHRSSFCASYSNRFAVRFEIGKVVSFGVKVTDLILTHQRDQVVSFGYRLNYQLVELSESRLVSLERNSSK